ncbi:MAG: phosphatase domain-containing protein [Aureispira sp.]
MSARPALHIQLYTAFFTSSHLYLRGRLLKDQPLVDKENGSVWRALFYTGRRALSREIAHQKVQVILEKHVVELTTDKEGYFEWQEAVAAIPTPTRTGIQLNVPYKKQDHLLPIQLEDYSQSSSIGIISDIDDTIMVTGVQSFFKLKVALNTLFINPFRRKPIEDAAAAFHDLSQQATGQGPVIYISNSPWNLYNYLYRFLQHHNFPKGIITLRDMGWQLFRSRSLEEGNKYKEIKKILATFNSTSFILIGDSGELDFDIYQKILAEHPDRIHRIIINKAGNKEKEAAILQYAQQHPIVELIQGYSSLLKE